MCFFNLTCRYISIIFFSLFSFISLTAQVGINTTSPSAGAILDIESATKGILIPRIDILDLGLISPVTGAGTQSLLVYNIGTVTQAGFYYWNVATTEWLPLTIQDDDDFYEVGTTTAAQNITDDIFRTGKVAIGKTTATYPLDIEDASSTRTLNVKLNGSTAGPTYSFYSSNENTSNAVQYGIYSMLQNGTGTGNRYGMYNKIKIPGSQTNQAFGIYNDLSTATGGNGSQTGTFNRLGGNGIFRSKIGVSNYITGTDNAAHKGVSNNISSSGTGDHTGTYNQVKGDGTIRGTWNKINDVIAVGKTGYGTYNDVNSQTGKNVAGYFYAHHNSGATGTYYAAIFESGHVVANEAGGDWDFRIEGQTDTNLFFADASTDRVGIGTATPGYTLDVSGDINLTGTLRNSGGAYAYPDYVFEKYFDGFSNYNIDYTLESLESIESFLKEHKHLPNVQNRKDVQKKGWDLTEGIHDNLEKVEELFLYTIEASKKIKKLETENDLLSSRLDRALQDIEKITKRLNEIEE